jgi:hypothetical protein
VPTVLMIGQKDTTAVGKDRAPPDLAKAFGNYPKLGREVRKRIKGSVLLRFPELGHSPQVQDPPVFNNALIEQLARLLSDLSFAVIGAIPEIFAQTLRRCFRSGFLGTRGPRWPLLGNG